MFFQANTIKLDGLTPQEMIGIIDDTLACVVNFQMIFAMFGILLFS